MTNVAIRLAGEWQAVIKDGSPINGMDVHREEALTALTRWKEAIKWSAFPLEVMNLTLLYKQCALKICWME